MTYCNHSNHAPFQAHLNFSFPINEISSGQNLFCSYLARRCKHNNLIYQKAMEFNSPVILLFFFTKKI